jgi:excisionase family DNA binding protein
MTTREAAERLGVSVRAVQALIQRGRLKAEKIGRDWILLTRDVEDYALTRRSPGRPPRDC